MLQFSEKSIYSITLLDDLVREIDLPVRFEFMTASSYGSATVSSGEVKIVSELDNKIVGRHVILVEDIVDSGRTIAYIKNDMLKNFAEGGIIEISVEV